MKRVNPSNHQEICTPPRPKEELAPLPQALKNLGMSVGIFICLDLSTGRVTGDLRIFGFRLYGDGHSKIWPKSSLLNYSGSRKPQFDGYDLTHVATISPRNTLSTLGLLSGEGGQIAADSFERYGDYVVGVIHNALFD